METEKIIEYIKNYVKNAHSKGVVIGMSGGKDSFVTAKLCSLALGNQNVFGVIMPDGKMKDITVAEQECKLLNIRYTTLDIKGVTDQIKLNTKAALKTEELSEVTLVNIAPRVRMTTLYSIAGTLGYLVVNTSNLSESMIGYTTKYGDSVGDFAPLLTLTKTEVCNLGLELGLPEKFVLKKPDDGLSGKTDEEKIGFTYDELDEYIRTGNKGENFDKILKMHKNSAHKRGIINRFESGKQNYFDNII